MTEERKKYLASINKEERAIRLELTIQKNRIQYLKELIKHPIHMDDKRTILKLMQDTRFIIKALKKQLPAPKKIIGLQYVHIEECPKCVGVDVSYDNYCPSCGQKLR